MSPLKRQHRMTFVTGLRQQPFLTLMIAPVQWSILERDTFASSREGEMRREPDDIDGECAKP